MGIVCLSALKRTGKWAKQAEVTDNLGKKGKAEPKDNMDLG